MISARQFKAAAGLGGQALPPVISARAKGFWFVALAALIFTVPPLMQLARNVWSLEQGAHGPIILASGLWLLVHEASRLTPGPSRPAIVAALLVPALIAHLFSSIVGMIWLQWLSTYAALVAVFYAYVGGSMIRRLWFPLAYLLFLVPPPHFLIGSFTNSRKMWLSTTGIDMLSALGFDVARSGTTLYIDQYELLVADACAGINSLFSLLAIGCFYIYLLHRADWRYCAILAVLVLPIAMFANLVRVLLLLLVTHYFGDAFAQGPFHKLAGIVMFVAALACFVLVDAILSPLRRRLQRT